MDRRKFLQGTAVGLSAAIAGCSDQTPDPSADSLSVTDGILEVAVSNPQHTDRVEFEVERDNTATVSVSEESPTATYDFVDVETVGTEDQNRFHNTEVTIKIYKTDGSLTESIDWLYRPELELTNLLPAKEMEYEPDNHSQAATPILEITNTGTGPTRISELVAFRIRDDAPLKKATETTSFAHAAIAREATDDRFSPVETHKHGDFYIPGSESVYIALDGFFTHSGREPESVAQHQQVFDLRIDWLFDEPEYTVTVDLKGGVQRSNGAEDYRFESFELVDIDLASPLK